MYIIYLLLITIGYLLILLHFRRHCIDIKISLYQSLPLRDISHL